MIERMGHPGEMRDILNGQEKPLVRAAQDLARAVLEIEPNPEYAPQPPRALIVGGFVRDLMLGLKPKDADVEVYGVAPAEVVALLNKMFGSVNEAGKAFGVLKVAIGDGLELDVSIPRRESKSGLGHTGFLVNSDPSLDITEAARRRDFSVNAMAMDPLTGAIFDPFGGLEDVKAKTLRVTDPAKFVEDPLRVLRAMQFLARLEFAVDPESERLMRGMVERGVLSELPRERITGEFEKLLSKANRPSIGLEFARKNGIIEATFPGAAVPDWDEWKTRLDRAAHAPRHAALAAFVSGFDDASREPVIGSLSIRNRDADAVRSILEVAAHPEASTKNAANDARRTLRRIRPAAPDAYAAYLRATGRAQEAERFSALVRDERLNADDLLQGRDLIDIFRLKPGPRFREIIAAVEAARDEGTVETREQALELVKTLL